MLVKDKESHFHVQLMVWVLIHLYMAGYSMEFLLMEKQHKLLQWPPQKILQAIISALLEMYIMDMDDHQ